MNLILYARYAVMFIDILRELRKRKIYAGSAVEDNDYVLRLFDITKRDRDVHHVEIFEQFIMDYKGHGFNSEEV